MGQQNSASVASSYLERLRGATGLLFERDDQLLQKFQTRTDVEVVGERTMRLNLNISPGGRAGKANLDGGDLGRGSAPKTIEATLSPRYYKFAVEATKLVEIATNSNKKAIENRAKRNFKDGIAQFRAFLDKLVQTSGDGVLGSVSGAPVNNGDGTYTLTTAAPSYAARFYEQQELTVLTSNFATNRGYVEVTAVDIEGKTITVKTADTGGAVLANIVSTDVLCVHGITGTGTPTELFGLKYHHNAASTGTWMNVNRATYPQIRTPKVTANSSLTTAHPRLAKNKIRKKLGSKALSAAKFMAYMSVEQEHAWEQLGLTISQIIRESGGGEKMKDLLFGESGNMAGSPIMTSINADVSRIDFVALENFFRAVIQEIDMYEVGGQTIFPVYGTSGGLAAAFVYYWILGMQVGCDNPSLGAYIDTLTVPDGY